MTLITSTASNTTSKTERGVNSNYQAASWTCLFSASTYTAALIAIICLVEFGALSDLSPAKLLNFIPDNIILWRCVLGTVAIASLSFLVFVLAVKETFEQRYNFFANIATVFSCISSTCLLIAAFSMMILFSDLSLLIRTHSDYLRADISQMAWMTMNQALSQAVLIANSLQGVSGAIMAGCILSSSRYANWLGWFGLLVSLLCLTVSLATFAGSLQWSLLLGFVTVTVYVIWLLVLGWMYRTMARTGL